MAINPTFHTALMGYQKAEVLDCLNRMASEIDTYASRQEAADKTIASMKAAKAGAAHYRDALDRGVFAYTGSEDAEQAADKGDAQKDGASA